MNEARDVRSMGENRTIPISKLRLDPHNPRLPADVQGHSQLDLAVHLELGFDALTVAESIASHGYFGSEPVIVIKDPDAGENWIVVEGNRRLTALLGLVNADIRSAFANPSPWEELSQRSTISASDLIPAVVLPSRAKATPIIGFRHISGILQWQPYAQARYIARLIDEEGMDFASVAKMIGVDRTKVGNLYRDQAIAKQAKEMGIETGPMEESFSLMTVAMSTTKLRDHISAPLGSRTQPGQPPVPGDKTNELRELITWIYGEGEEEPVIGESRDISRLGNVVANPTGLQSLRGGDTLDAATQKIKEADAHPRDRLIKRLRTGRNSLTAALDDAADFSNDTEVCELIDDARAASDALLAAIERE